MWEEIVEHQWALPLAQPASEVLPVKLVLNLNIFFGVASNFQITNTVISLIKDYLARRTMDKHSPFKLTLFVNSYSLCKKFLIYSTVCYNILFTSQMPTSGLGIKSSANIETSLFANLNIC